MEQKNTATNATKVYATMCKAMDALELKYTKSTDEPKIHFTIGGDDIPMEMIIKIDEERDLIKFISMLPFKMSKDKIVDAAVAISAINYKLCDGGFSLDIKDGTVFYIMTYSYRESLIGEEFFNYILIVSSQTIDEYNDKLLMLNKGMVDVNHFIKGK